MKHQENKSRLSPSNRLIWAAALAIPFETMLYLNIALAPICILVTGILLLAVILDYFRSSEELDKLEVRWPDITRMTQGKEYSFATPIRFPVKKSLRVAIELPNSLGEPDSIKEIIPQDSNSFYEIDWQYASSKRGQVIIKELFIETDSKWSFWTVRKSFPVHMEFRIYPDLFQTKDKAALAMIYKTQQGFHVQRYSGQGREFEKLREYYPGDPFEDIHWKASARKGELMTKTYQIESNQDIYVALDISRLSGRLCPEKEQQLLEYFIQSTLMLSIMAESQNDAFGLITFHQKVDQFIKAKAGKQSSLVCKEALYNVSAQNSSSDFNELAQYIRLNIRKRSLIIILACLDDPILCDQLSKSMQLLAGQHVIYVNGISPNACQPGFQNEDLQSSDEIYSDLAGHLNWNENDKIYKALSPFGVHAQTVHAPTLATKILDQYINVKQRQLI